MSVSLNRKWLFNVQRPILSSSHLSASSSVIERQNLHLTTMGFCKSCVRDPSR